MAPNLNVSIILDSYNETCDVKFTNIRQCQVYCLSFLDKCTEEWYNNCGELSVVIILLMICYHNFLVDDIFGYLDEIYGKCEKVWNRCKEDFEKKIDRSCIL